MQYQSGAVSPVESVQKGWDLIKNDYWVFFGMTAIMVVILIVASLILNLINSGITAIIASVLGITTSHSGDVATTMAAVAPQLISMVISIFTSVIVSTVTGCLFCGIYAALSRKANIGVSDFGDLFSGFQKFQPCLIVAIVLSLIQFVVGVVMLLAGVAMGVSAVGTGMLMTKDGQLNTAVLSGLIGMALVFFMILILVNLIISALTTFVYPLIGERNLSGGDALMTSIKSGFANIGGLILLLILSAFMLFVGALGCGVGALFVLPIVIAGYFSAYQSVFGATGNQYNYSPPPPPNFNNQPGY